INNTELDNNVLDQGGEYDWATGDTEFQRRIYQAAIQRWMQAEPSGGIYVDGANLYLNEADNPLNRTDSTGRRATAIDAEPRKDDKEEWIKNKGEDIEPQVRANEQEKSKLLKYLEENKADFDKSAKDGEILWNGAEYHGTFDDFVK